MKKNAILPLALFYWIVLLSYPSICYTEPSVLSNYQAIYTVKYDGLKIGTSTTSLLISSHQHYQYCIRNMTTLPFLHGFQTECSFGVLINNQIQPQVYTYDYQRGQTQQHISVNFNWSNHTAITRVNGQPWRMSIPANTQDKISYQLALRIALASGRQILSYLVADGGKIKTYQFSTIGQEVLQTPMGNFNTIKLSRTPILGKEKLTLWISRNSPNLVIKAEQQRHFINTGTAELAAIQ